jgi:hypothetical protein
MGDKPAGKRELAQALRQEDAPGAGRQDPCSLLHIGPYEVPRRTAAEVRAWLLALVSADAGEGDSEADPGLLALIKASASTVSLASMLTEISRLEAVRAIGLPAGLFADVASRPRTPREVHMGTV